MRDFSAVFRALGPESLALRDRLAALLPPEMNEMFAYPTLRRNEGGDPCFNLTLADGDDLKTVLGDATGWLSTLQPAFAARRSDGFTCELDVGFFNWLPPAAWMKSLLVPVDLLRVLGSIGTELCFSFYFSGRPRIARERGRRR